MIDGIPYVTYIIWYTELYDISLPHEGGQKGEIELIDSQE